MNFPVPWLHLELTDNFQRISNFNNSYSVRCCSPSLKRQRRKKRRKKDHFSLKFYIRRLKCFCWRFFFKYFIVISRNYYRKAVCMEPRLSTPNNLQQNNYYLFSSFTLVHCSCSIQKEFQTHKNAHMF